MSAAPTWWSAMAAWPIWSRGSRVTGPVLIVEAATLGLIAAAVLELPATPTDVRLTIVLALLAVVHTEVATGIERLRRRVGSTSYFDLTSVWTFAGALLLPPALTTVVVLVVYVHLWFRVWKPARVPLYRHVFSIAVVLLAAFAAHAAVVAVGSPSWAHGLPGLATLGLATLVYATVNSALIAAAVALSDPRSTPTQLLGHLSDNLLEFATLCLGALAAVAITVSLWYLVLVLPPLLVLHRAVLVRQLEEAVSTDTKTGLLTAAAWQQRASAEVRRAQQRATSAAAVLVLDLDHFKAVNDTHGHLAGDQVLAAVAGALRDEVRTEDLVGRFGGEEFVVLLPRLPLPAERATVELGAVAERIRRRIGGLRVAVDTPDGELTIQGLSTSVGGAAFPATGGSLESVLKAADGALYAAKDAGRNAVRIVAEPGPPGSPRAHHEPRT